MTKRFSKDPVAATTDDKRSPDVAPDQGKAVDKFINAVAAAPRRTDGRRGRLMFAIDATASRQPTWDRAAQLQGEMFKVASSLGGLEIQLAFFRGFGEFKVAPWTPDTDHLLRLMTSVHCGAGETQINKMLSHAVNEAKRQPFHALVYVGDCFEEDVDRAGKLAGDLGLLGVPAFMFQEGVDAPAAFAFQEVARLSGGAYCPFDRASAAILRRLLEAVAVYAAGGRAALEDHAGRAGGDVLQIVDQMYGKRGK